MGLLLLKKMRTDAEGNYWRISLLKLDFIQRKIQVRLDLYTGRSSWLRRAAPLETKKMEYPLVSTVLIRNLIAACYGLVKAPVFHDNIQLNPFADSEDVIEEEQKK